METFSKERAMAFLEFFAKLIWGLNNKTYKPINDVILIPK